MAQNGMIGGVETTLTKAMLDSAFTAIAFTNVIELLFRIALTFRRRSGLYFYSMLAASLGIVIYALASLMKFYRVWQNDYVSISFITIGWYAMVTGQSLVLYSRLHLVVHDRRRVRWILYMIIIDAFLFHVPTTVMTFGANSPLVTTFAIPYSIMEKVQVTAFTVQESIISFLYVYHTHQMLAPASSFHKKRAHTVMTRLIIVNVIIIALDLTLLGTEYANQYEIETTYKGALYSVKLRLEFAVLGQLMAIVRPHNATSYGDEPGTMAVNADGTREVFTSGGFRLSRPLDSRAKPKNETISTCFAGREQSRGKFGVSLDENRVLKTTEIAVDVEDGTSGNNLAVSSPPPRYPDVAMTSGKAFGNPGREEERVGSEYSPTSSQVDFASRGY